MLLTLRMEKYKNEAINLAKKTIRLGGRIALYEYKEYPYTLIKHCGFDDCKLEDIDSKIEQIFYNNTDVLVAGDSSNSPLLSAGLQVMRELNWKFGSSKSVVVFTDTPYHDPGLGDTIFMDVVNLSKEIDPVNFYVVTPEEFLDGYSKLATETGGRVVSDIDNLPAFFDSIMARYDSLPQVEESAKLEEGLPNLNVNEINKIKDSLTVKFSTNGSKVLIILNDALIGITEENYVTINDLDDTKPHELRLIPLNKTRRGNSVVISNDGIKKSEILVPKAPNTGKR